MADYPLPKFHFQVEWGGTQIGFTEVSGLNFETDVIEYRHGASPEYNVTKQPGLTKFSDITMKRGTFQSDNEFYEWWNKNKLFEEGNDPGSQFRRDITISLLNESHEPTVVWNVRRAWVKELQTTDLKSDDSSVAIETVVLAHEGLTLEFQ